MLTHTCALTYWEIKLTGQLDSKLVSVDAEATNGGEENEKQTKKGNTTIFYVRTSLGSWVRRIRT